MTNDERKPTIRESAVGRALARHRFKSDLLHQPGRRFDYFGGVMGEVDRGAVAAAKNATPIEISDTLLEDVLRAASAADGFARKEDLRSALAELLGTVQALDQHFNQPEPAPKKAQRHFETIGSLVAELRHSLTNLSPEARALLDDRQRRHLRARAAQTEDSVPTVEPAPTDDALRVLQELANAAAGRAESLLPRQSRPRQHVIRGACTLLATMHRQLFGEPSLASFEEFCRVILSPALPHLESVSIARTILTLTRPTD